MTYSISKGIPQKQLPEWLRSAKQKYGVFEDGRVDYTKATEAPIVMCTVIYNDHLLLAKRGYGLADAEGYWSTINGFIDEVKPISQQVKQEVREELGIILSDHEILVGDSYTLNNPNEKRSYIVFPCLVSLSKVPKILLNEEHTDFTWITRAELGKYHILEDLPYAIDAAMKLRPILAAGSDRLHG